MEKTVRKKKEKKKKDKESRYTRQELARKGKKKAEEINNRKMRL